MLIAAHLSGIGIAFVALEVVIIQSALAVVREQMLMTIGHRRRLRLDCKQILFIFQKIISSIEPWEIGKTTREIRWLMSYSIITFFNYFNVLRINVIKNN